MEPEDRLSGALHATLDAARPSPDLEDRIVERVSVAGRRTVRSNVRFGFAGVAALVVVVAIVSVAVGLRTGPGHDTTGPSAGSDIAAGSLARFDRDGLAFDYPASWKASVSGFNLHYETILDFLGTGSGLATCTAITPGPSDKFLSGTQCGADLNVGAGQVVVELSLEGGPFFDFPIDPSDPKGIESGGKYVTVGGLPAISYEETLADPASGATLDWTLSVPEQVNSRFTIHAEIKSPGAQQMRAQVEALVASLRYDPPAPLLNPADGPRIAAIGLAKAGSSDPALACFPSAPGTTATATVTQVSGYSALRKPLPVTCGTEIAPVSIGLWKLTLTESWTAASDRSAGSFTIAIWLAADGTPGETRSGPVGSSMVPYLP
jgi:hypothetical protein